MDEEVKSLCAKYGLTLQQGKDLEDQYWTEHVVKRLCYRTNDQIFMINLGSFKLRKSFLVKKISNHKKYILELYSEKVKLNYKEKIAILKREIYGYFGNDKEGIYRSFKRVVVYTGENPTDFIRFISYFSKKIDKAKIRRENYQRKQMLRKR